MPAKYLNYPMEFVNPNTDEIRALFGAVGLPSETTNKRQESQELRDELLGKSCLFTMARPLWGAKSTSLAYSYFHPQYTKDALREMPNRRNYRYRVKDWMATATLHLQDFGAQPHAREIISSGIVRHFNNIADVTVRFPHTENKPWIPAYPTEEGVDALGRLGVTAKRAAIGDNEIYKDKSDNGRTYFEVEKIAQHVSWTIPGIESKETRKAITEGFAATHDKDRAVDPQALFLAGTVLHNSVHMDLGDLFSCRTTTYAQDIHHITAAIR